MKKSSILAPISAFAIIAIACDDSSNIGSSIVDDQIAIVNDSSFTLSGHSAINSVIQSRTITQLLGSIDAGDYGKLNSDFVTQFMPAAKIDTTGMIIDGLTLRLAVPRSSGYVGDTLIPMGLEVYRLNQQLPYPIYSDFYENVSDYYDESAPIASKIYNFNTLGCSDTLQALSYINIDVDMPKALAEELVNIYKTDPTAYLVPEMFAQKFPGIYVRNSYGSGRIVKIGATSMAIKYHTEGKTDAGNDTTYNYIGNYYAVSPEIITNNNIRYDMSAAMQSRLTDGECLLVAPTGIETEIEFPINNILNSYLNGAGKLAVINSLSFVLPIDTIANQYGINPPDYVLMVRSSEKQNFFANNLITDGVTSFLGTYNATYNRYEFPDMRQYLIDRVGKGPATPEEYTFTLTPVSVSVENNSSNYYYSSVTTTVNSITPYVETPVMAKISLEDAKIILSYSKQTIKN
ncbi:MAG: DUF4270 domain-containing protein [Bacteroidales bacterium]|nr:DUF4270 domain-containing protein [Bacteroidales bacterium]